MFRKYIACIVVVVQPARGGENRTSANSMLVRLYTACRSPKTEAPEARLVGSCCMGACGGVAAKQIMARPRMWTIWSGYADDVAEPEKLNVSD